MNSNAPHRLYETFELSLDGLFIPATNMRAIDAADPKLYELAISLQAQGQIHPVLVIWQNERYELVVGFRRGHAMKLYREELGFETIRATRIRPEEADAARLVENFVRENPSTYEIAAYFVRLNRGEGVGAKMSTPQIAAVVGKSPEYVRTLTRFFRDLPAEAKAAWAADRDERFSFRALNDLIRLKREGDEAGIARKLERLLDLKPSKPEALGYKSADECLRDAISGVGIDEPRASSAVKRRRARPMPGAEIRELEAQLARVSRERLALHELSADVVLDLLQAIAGKTAGMRAVEIVTDIVLTTTASSDLREGGRVETSNEDGR